LGDDHNFSEDVLLKLHNLPENLAELLAQSIAMGNVKEDVAERQQERQPPLADDAPRWQKTLEKTFTPRNWKKMSRAERREAHEYLKVLVMQLEELGLD
jgi:hypothetical protein